MVARIKEMVRKGDKTWGMKDGSRGRVRKSVEKREEYGGYLISRCRGETKAETAKQGGKKKTRGAPKKKKK